jgi:ABC-type phosphonate transport system ATPase subunit
MSEESLVPRAEVDVATQMSHHGSAARGLARAILGGVAAIAVVAVAATSGDAKQKVPATASAAKARVPNEVGRNHQAAQDDLQAHGFYNLREVDCTGRDRLLIWDRNWKVVKQSPKAGARVSKSPAITLCSVKYTD